nr:MAG TPA: hypothetical protein [Caudoviricetes sp.]
MNILSDRTVEPFASFCMSTTTHAADKLSFFNFISYM